MFVPKKWRGEAFCLSALVSQNIFFESFIRTCCLAKSLLKIAEIKCHFASQKKKSIKNWKIMFYDTYSKAKKHYTIFPENVSSVIIQSTAHCAEHSFFLNKNILSMAKYFSHKKMTQCFFPWKLVSQTYFGSFYQKCLARKIAAKTTENDRKSTILKHQKRIKIWKVVFCDTYTQRQKICTIFFLF